MTDYEIFPLRIEGQQQAEAMLGRTDVWQAGVEIMAPKAQHFVLRVRHLRPHAAQIIKQEMLSKGGEAALSGKTLKHEEKECTIVLMGTAAQFDKLIPKLRMQPFGLKYLANDLRTVLDRLQGNTKLKELFMHGKRLSFGENTLTMGVLNLTPDSFSDGGRFNSRDDAVKRALEIEREGADIIDIGAESTRPGSTPISAEEESSRLFPVLEEVVKQVRIPVSVDTYKSGIAREALEKGADIINDISGLSDPEMAGVVAEAGAPLIIMHSVREEADDIVDAVISALKEKKAQAVEAGIKEKNIILDPGIGFAKNTAQNLEILNRFDSLKCLGQPLMLGTSRKSLIKNTLDLPVGERLEGTAATVVVGIMRGAHIVRVHDVREMIRAARMTDAILKAGVSGV